MTNDEDHKRDLRVEAGAWLRSLRQARGLSQREFAERVGTVYHTFISQIEAGRGRIPSERYEIWARALEIDPREFSIKMLGFYEPATYNLIFGERESRVNFSLQREQLSNTQGVIAS